MPVVRCKVCNKKLRNQPRNALCADHYAESRIEYMPTPDEIREACLFFQAGWSETERKQRAGYVRKPYDKPVFRMMLGNDGRPPEDFHNDYDADIFISAISAYEVSLKHRLGLWPEIRPLIDDFEALAQRAHFQMLSVTTAHAIRAGLLPIVHRDPFDRIIVAQANIERLRVVSKDRQLAALGAEVVWG